MRIDRRLLANWGNYPRMEVEMAFPEDREALTAYVKAQTSVIARGNGKCYGDAALGPQVVSTLALNRILRFDPEEGVVECEAGVLLSDLIPVIVPAGWFFHVTPGIKHITIGGAIASDVHGKNHPLKGCFSNWVEWFDLLTGEGRVVRCSKTENTDLFWQTCGGMGWTGVVLSAQFRLMRIQSVMMEQTAVRADGLDGLFEAFEARAGHPYAAGWVDCLASGRHTGRGVVYFARHHEPAQQEGLHYPEKKPKNVPFYAPSWLLNPLSIRIHNEMLFSGAGSKNGLVDMDRYFYPLDAIRNWNRLYGRRGFIQYQFCLPETESRKGIRRVLDLLHERRMRPFLSVLKRHGERAPEAVHSFPIRGYSLALDFPMYDGIFDLVPALDDLVWDHGGKIYLTKDACSAPRMGRLDPAAFGDARFVSALRERLSK